MTDPCRTLSPEQTRNTRRPLGAPQVGRRSLVTIPAGYIAEARLGIERVPGAMKAAGNGLGFEITHGVGRLPRPLERNASIANRADAEGLFSPRLQPAPARRMQIETRGVEL